MITRSFFGKEKNCCPNADVYVAKTFMFCEKRAKIDPSAFYASIKTATSSSGRELRTTQAYAMLPPRNNFNFGGSRVVLTPADRQPRDRFLLTDSGGTMFRAIKVSDQVRKSRDWPGAQVAA
jgi:hypothetical protein